MSRSWRPPPEIALYRSRNLALITEVVERAFRGDNASRIGYRDMVRIIRTVIEEFRDASWDPNALNRAPEAYLKDWIGGDRNLEDGLWFLRDQHVDDRKGSAGERLRGSQVGRGLQHRQERRCDVPAVLGDRKSSATVIVLRNRRKTHQP